MKKALTLTKTAIKISIETLTDSLKHGGCSINMPNVRSAWADPQRELIFVQIDDELFVMTA